MSRIVYIMGKSAAGKDHIYRELLQDQDLRLFSLVLYTTRPMRNGEADGREYFFVNEDRLEQFRRSGQVIEERVYDTVYGPWVYFTADDGQIDLKERDYLGIGTLESYRQLVSYFGQDALVPLYIEAEDRIRLERAMRREEKQPHPKYAEMCRRYLADEEDFSEKKLAEAGIDRRYANNGALSACVEEIKKTVRGSM